MKRLMWLFFTAVIILGLSGCGEKETIGIPPVLTGMSMSAIQRTVCFILIRFPRIGSSAFLIMRQRSIFPVREIQLPPRFRGMYGVPSVG